MFNKIALWSTDLIKKKHSIKIDLFFLDRSYNLFFEKERRDTLTWSAENISNI